MKGETNNKRQAKLLAAVAVMAMVVCALAVAMPAEEADGIIGIQDITVPEGATPITTTLPTDAGSYILNGDSGKTGIFTLNANATIPAGVNIYIVDGGTLAAGAHELKIEGNVYVTGSATGGSITSNDTSNIVVSGGLYADEKGTLGNVVGTGQILTLTAGQVLFKTNADGGFDLTITGKATTGSTALTLGIRDNVTLTDGSELTLGAALENRGSITLGTGAKIVGATYTVSSTGEFNAVAATDGSNVNYFSTFAEAVAFTGVTSITVFGDFSASTNNITLTSTFNAVNFNAGSGYNGTITWNNNDTTPTKTQTVAVTVIDATDDETITSDANGIAVTGSQITTGTDGTSAIPIGSTVTINGATSTDSNSTPDPESLTVSDVSLGNMTLNVDVSVSDSKAVIVPSNSTLIFGSGEITLGTTDTAGKASMYVYGGLDGTTGAKINGKNVDPNDSTIYAMDTMAASYFKGGNVTIESLGSGIVEIELSGNNAADLKKLINVQSGMTVYIEESTASNLILEGDVNLNGITIYLGPNVNLQVGTAAKGASVSMNGVYLYTVDTIADVANPVIVYIQDEDQKIDVVNGTLSINKSYLYIQVEKQTKGEVASVPVNSVIDEPSSDVMVGYGNTLTLTGSGSTVLSVYGDLIINTTASVAKNKEMTVFAGGNVTVNGTLNILGTANFVQGSTATVEGSVVVGNSTDGSAVLNIDGDFTVDEAGTLTVTAINKVNKNILAAPDSRYATNGEGKKEYAYRFVVLGTLNMNGALSGYVHNQGTVNIDGFAVGNNIAEYSGAAYVVMYEGITMTVDSFDGGLNITDAGIVDSQVIGNYMKVSDGNMITLRDIAGATISESVDVISYNKDGNNHRDFRTVMSLSGDVSIVDTDDGAITIGKYTGANTAGVGSDGKSVAYAIVPEGSTMDFGIDVSLRINAPLTVAGEITFIDASTRDDVDGKTIDGSSTLTVTGKIDITYGMMELANTNINAAMYTVRVTGANASVTETYTNFVAAVTAAPEAYNDLVTVMGTITSGTVDIPAGVTVTMLNNANITVTSGSTVVLKDGATLTGQYGSYIYVDGTFTSEDYAMDMGGFYRTTNVIADVIIDETPSMTWTSLGSALGMGITDIVLNRDVSITEDTTIPEGTTVSTVYSVYVFNDATLTVDGTLAMTPKENKVLSLQDPEGVNTMDGTIVIGGVVSVKTMDDLANFEAVLKQSNGVFFKVTSGAYTIAYMTNMEFAAETVSNNTSVVTDINGNALVEIIGSVGAGDVSFTSATGLPILIKMATYAPAGETAKQSVLSMGTLTLNGQATLSVTGDSIFTGTVSAACGTDGTADVVFDSAVGVTVATGIEYTADGTEYTVTVTGIGAGEMTVASGDVALGGSVIGQGAAVTIASGAVVTIPSGIVLTFGDEDNLGTVPLSVDGTLVVKNANGIAMAHGAENAVYVSGTLDVNADLVLPADLAVYVTGTVDTDAKNVLTINDKLVLGTPADSLGAMGVLSGAVTINNGAYIVAYAGADLSGAKINWNAALDQSGAKTTTYNINGMQYATVYAVGGVTVGQVFGVNGEKISITGYVSDNDWYASAEEADIAATETVNGQAIGRYANVYAEFLLDEVKGTVSKDAGIILTIDGLVVSPSGYGDQSFTYKSFPLSVGTHTIAWSERSGYTFADVTVTFNGVEVENGGTITITADMQSYTIIVSGSEPSVAATGGDDGLGLTDYLLIILVVLIVVMAVMVALRLMRS